MLTELVMKTGYKIAADAISKGSKLKSKIAPRISDQLSVDTLDLGNKSSLPYRSIVLPKLNSLEIGNLERLDDDNFIRKSQSIICRILGIPDEVRPQIVYLPFEDANCLARYNVAHHRIELPADFFEMGSRGQFVTLAHELKHADQSLAVLRSSKLAQVFLDEASKGFIQLNQPVSYITNNPTKINAVEDLSILRKKTKALLGELPKNQTKYVQRFLLPSKRSGSLGYFLSQDEMEAYLFDRLVSAEYKRAAKEYYSKR